MLLALFERMEGNHSIYELRYRHVKTMALKSLNNWLARYMAQPRAVRRDYRSQYKRTRKLVLRLERFPTKLLRCGQLLVRIKPKMDPDF